MRPMKNDRKAKRSSNGSASFDLTRGGASHEINSCNALLPILTTVFRTGPRILCRPAGPIKIQG